MSRSDKITVTIVIIAVTLLILRLGIGYGQEQQASAAEIYEDGITEYFEQRGYNITIYDFDLNGTLIIVAKPIQ